MHEQCELPYPARLKLSTLPILLAGFEPDSVYTYIFFNIHLGSLIQHYHQVLGGTIDNRHFLIVRKHNPRVESEKLFFFGLPAKK